MSGMNDMAKESSIVLAVSGGIAAYKAVTVASRLFQAGHQVHVLMSEGAQRFVTPLTFSAVTRRKVICSIFPDDSATEGEALFPHLYPASHADVFCAVPATSSFIGRIAGGMADDICAAAALPLRPDCRRYFCPAMNAAMWRNDAVRTNARTLRDRGWMQIGPDEGVMACGDMGYGRMTEPEEIVKVILDDLERPRPLAGKRVMILSGPTRERIDPVRYISNDSSGKMGKALAIAASQAGAEVTFVTGPIDSENVPIGPSISVTRVESADEMLSEARGKFPACDTAIFVAAVADYRPSTISERKMEKSLLTEGISLTENPDVAKTLCATKRSDQVCIGFALQTHDGLDKAKEKLASKGLDAIVLNGPDSFGSDSGDFSIVTNQEIHSIGCVDKRVCARIVLDWVSKH